MPLKKQLDNYPETKLTLTRLLKNSIKASGEFRSFKMPVWPSLLSEFYTLEKKKKSSPTPKLLICLSYDTSEAEEIKHLQQSHFSGRFITCFYQKLSPT